MRVRLGKRVLLRSLCFYAGLAQLVRASALQAGGHWFESSTPHQYGECSSEEERRIVAPEVEISKFFTYPKVVYLVVGS